MGGRAGAAMAKGSASSAGLASGLPITHIIPWVRVIGL